ncbi:elongation factor G, mitochondrial-like [Bidens hawaiensis]|uniref:elongation factor G, mitochondrial-like n=1 Tax=Bidens hawaiensis TaxID=980011 RepID=UPI00404B5DE6
MRSLGLLLSTNLIEWEQIHGGFLIRLGKKLRHHNAAVQIPIGLEEDFQSLIDLVQQKAYSYYGSSGFIFKNVANIICIFGSEKVVTEEIPYDMQAMAAEKRRELIEAVSDVDDELAELFLSDEPTSSADLAVCWIIYKLNFLKQKGFTLITIDVVILWFIVEHAAIRRATIARKFIPLFMGSAFKNKGVQPLLDGVLHYLPSPLEVDNFALDRSKKEEKVKLSGTPARHMVALAFKLEERQFGQLTYLRSARLMVPRN